MFHCTLYKHRLLESFLFLLRLEILIYSPLFQIKLPCERARHNPHLEQEPFHMKM